MDKKYRNKIIMQAVRKWCLYAFATFLLVSLGSFCMRPSTSVVSQMLENIWYLAPVAAASLVLLPLLIWEILADNNRITGPIRRLRGELQKLKNNRPIRELRLRDNDHWHELASEFNELVQQIHSERNQTVDDSPPTIFSIRESGR